MLTGVTPPGALTGFRALVGARPTARFDAVVGSIDATGKGSVLLDDHPMGGDVTSRTCASRCRATRTRHEVAGEQVADLAPFHNVEGCARPTASVTTSPTRTTGSPSGCTRRARTIAGSSSASQRRRDALGGQRGPQPVQVGAEPDQGGGIRRAVGARPRHCPA